MNENLCRNFVPVVAWKISSKNLYTAKGSALALFWCGPIDFSFQLILSLVSSNLGFNFSIGIPLKILTGILYPEGSRIALSRWGPVQLIYRFLCQEGSKSECSVFFNVYILFFFVIFFFFSLRTYPVFDIWCFVKKYHKKNITLLDCSKSLN